MAIFLGEHVTNLFTTYNQVNAKTGFVYVQNTFGIFDFVNHFDVCSVDRGTNFVQMLQQQEQQLADLLKIYSCYIIIIFLLHNHILFDFIQTAPTHPDSISLYSICRDDITILLSITKNPKVRMTI
jgi:hypothetical protein